MVHSSIDPSGRENRIKSIRPGMSVPITATLPVRIVMPSSASIDWQCNAVAHGRIRRDGISPDKAVIRPARMAVTANAREHERASRPQTIPGCQEREPR